MQQILAEILKNTPVSSSDIQKVCGLIHGMPLAAENIKQILTSDIKTCDINCVTTKLRQSPISLLTRSKSWPQHTVTSSIDIVYNQLREEHKKCGWLLAANTDDKFDGKTVATVIESKLPNVDHEECTTALLESYLLEVSKTMDVVDVSVPVCNISNTDYTLECSHNPSKRTEYKLHRLIKEYFLHKCREQELYDDCEKTKYKQSHTKQEQVKTSKSNVWEEVKQIATKRRFCPDQYMFLECATSWQKLHDAVSMKMISRFLITLLMM